MRKPADYPRRALERAMKKAVEGTPMQAKYAARFVAYSKHKEVPGELLDVSNLQLSETPNCSK